MQIGTSLVLLFVSALLETGGDALVRVGLRAPSLGARLAFFLAGAAVLLAYGYAVNRPPWDFGRLLGVYVVFFFIVAQAVAWLAFGQAPTRGIWLGGAFMVIGGAIVAATAK